MKYFAEFDVAGERITSYVADGMPYTEGDIRDNFPNAIEISEEDQAVFFSLSVFSSIKYDINN
jgi:hypothetical protein